MINPFANDVSAIVTRIVAENEARYIGIRRDIHAHPEVGFETLQTAALVAAELTQLGLAPSFMVGNTAVMAEIVGDHPGPCIILRADIDALPIQEMTGLPFASTLPGKMHACGHDIHTAALLGAAAVIRQFKQQLHGRVRLIFQPAEETVESGAAAMIAEGAADGVDMAIAFHNRPEMPVGRFGLTRGASTASSDEFDVVVHGKSGHAARPHSACDPIITAAAILMQLQTAVSRNMDPTDSAVLTVGQIEGGSTHNIIPDTCMFRGTVRCRSQQARDDMEMIFRRICGAVAEGMGASCEITYRRGVPPLVNADGMVDRAHASMAALFGETSIDLLPGRFGAEDFAYFSDRVPSCQLLIGASQPGRHDRVHNSDYQPDERCIALSTAVLAQMALDILR